MEIMDGLRRLGMGEYEARAYATLVAHPGGTGYEIAKQSGIPRAKIYETLAALVSRDLVATSQDDDRVRYHPLESEALLRRHLADAAALVRDLSPALKQIASGEEEYPLVTVRSYENVLARARDVLAACRLRAYVSGWPAEIEALVPDLERVEARGARVFALVYGDTAAAFPRLFRHHALVPSEGERPWPRLVGPLPSLVVVADHAEALIAQAAPKERTVALWSRQPAIAMVAAEYVKHDIYFAELDRLLAERGMSLDRELRHLQAMWFEVDWGDRR